MSATWAHRLTPDPFSTGDRIRRWAGRAKRAVRAKIASSAATVAEPSRTLPKLDFDEECNGACDKRALLSFVSWPFHASPEEVRRVHMCLQHSVEIARAFNRLGYVVDVIDMTDETFSPTRKYDALFGMHSNFARLAAFFPDAPKIYYATGPYWKDLRAAERTRQQELEQRFGVEVWIPSRIDETGFLDMADAVLSLGNAFVADKYRVENPNVWRIDNSAIPTDLPVPDVDRKDFSAARKNFLWMGSVDMVRKGLPALLDVFSKLPDLHLWVCGSFAAQHDRPLIKAYRRELFHTSNIHPVGWMDLHSPRFSEICDVCGWSILPSCGEGMAGSILDGMARGVVPIVSAEVGVDTDRCGQTLPDLSADSIRRCIMTAANISEADGRRQSAAAIQLAETRYTLSAYRASIERRLIDMMSHARWPNRESSNG